MQQAGGLAGGRALSPSFPLHLTVYRDIPEGKSAPFDLDLGPGF